jgi:hypothetical protein
MQQLLLTHTEERKMEETQTQAIQSGEREILLGQNRFYLDEKNVLNCIVAGYSDEKIALGTKESCIKLAQMVKGKVRVYIDLNNAGEYSSKARKIIRELTEHPKIGKCAVFGMHPVARVIAAFVIGVSGNRDMRFFKTKEDAITWMDKNSFNNGDLALWTTTRKLTA